MKSYNSSELGSLINSLTEWYGKQCDGDWEHSNGIEINTLDNPGWIVKIDLTDTDWEDAYGRIGPSEIDEVDWAIGQIKDGQFIGTGGLRNFGEIIEIFLKLIGSPEYRIWEQA